MSQPVFDPESKQPFERLLHALATSNKAAARLDHVDEDFAVLRMGRSIGVLMRYTGDESAVSERLAHLLPLAKQHPLEIAIFGGPSELGKRAKKAVPVFTTNRIQIYHLAEEGSLWRSAGRGAMGKVLDRVLSEPHSRLDWDAFWQKVSADTQEAEAQADEGQRFALAMSSRRPVVTMVLLATIGAMYGLQHLWGADLVPTFIRMGALYPPRLETGEWWRLISVAFLHGSVMHFAFNAYVLWALGSSLERILGSRRFIVLYGLSVVAGSFASAIFLKEGFSVGASGGLWGLLAAEGVLAMRPGGLLPASVIQSARRAAAFNLGINVLNSFRPHVDWAAHAGGGLMGAFLLLTGILTIGLPRLSEIELDQPIPKDQPPAWLAPAAMLVALALAAAPVIALVQGRPWMVKSEPNWERVEVRTLGISVDMPDGLVAAPVEPSEDGITEIPFGDLMADPAVVALFDIPLDEDAQDPEHREMLLEALKVELKSPVQGFEPLHDAEPIEVLGEAGLTIRYRVKDGPFMERSIVPVGARMWKVEAYMWPETEPMRRGLTKRVLSSIQALPAP